MFCGSASKKRRAGDSLRAKGPDLFKRWPSGGIEDLGEPAVTELLLDWIDSFITEVERDRMVAWQLGVNLQFVKLIQEWQVVRRSGWSSNNAK